MLVTCPECGAKISEDADPCPKCGKPDAGASSQEVEERREQENTKVIQQHKECVTQWNKHIQIGDQRKITRSIGYERCPHCGKRFFCMVVGAVLHENLCCLRLHCQKCGMKRLLYPPDFSTYTDDVYGGIIKKPKPPRGRHGQGN